MRKACSGGRSPVPTPYELFVLGRVAGGAAATGSRCVGPRPAPAIRVGALPGGSDGGSLGVAGRGPR